MADGLNEKLRAARSLIDALRILEAQPESRGALKIGAGKTKGAVAFADTKILGAFVKPSGEKGSDAVRKLMELQNVTVRLVDFDLDGIKESERVDIDLRSLLADVAPELEDKLMPEEAQQAEHATQPPAEEQATPPVISAPEGSLPEVEAEPAGHSAEPVAEVEVAPEGQAEAAEQKHELSEESAEETIALGAQQAYSQDDEQTQPVLPEASPAGGAAVDDSGEQTEEIDFSAKHAQLDTSDEALNEARLRMLELHSSFSDQEGFLQTDDRLQTTDGVQITERELDLLASLHVDDQAFEHVDVPVAMDVAALTDEQRQLLSQLAETAHDSKAFEQLSGQLHDTGLNLSEEQIWQLSEVMFARPMELQKEEFAVKDERLAHEHEAIVSACPAVDEMPAPGEPGQLDEIPSPQVLDADKSPLILFQEQLAPPVRKKAFDRVRDFMRPRFVVYARFRRLRKRFPIGRLIGSASLILLVVGTFMIPDTIRKAAVNRSAQQIALEQLTLTMQEDMANQVPTAAQDEARAASISAGAASGPSGAVSGFGSAIENDQLGYARSLIVEGKAEKALPYLADYLKSHSGDVRVAIELIQAYLATKHHTLARALCINTLKLHLTDRQIAEVWGFLRQCLTK